EPNWGRIHSMTNGCEPIAQCSGNFLIDRSQMIDGVEDVEACRFDHIVLLAEGAWRATAVWPDVDLQRAPSKIWNASQRWEDAHRRLKGSVSTDTHPRPLSKAARIAAVFAARKPAYRAMRERLFIEARKGNSIVVAHTVLSKAVLNS